MAARSAAIRRDIARERHLSFDREQHQLRLARLAAGVALLRFGGRSETGLARRKEVAMAAAGAVGAALRGGAVPGGGAALVEAARRLPNGTAGSLEMRMAVRILEAALTTPTAVIAANRGRDGRAMIAALLERSEGPAFGYDALADRVHDLATAGVMDALPVIEAGLRNAVSTGARLGSVAAAWRSNA